MTTLEARRTWTVARHLLAGQVPGLVVIWGLFAVAVGGITLLIAAFGTITASVWESASHLPPWFAVGMGVYLTAVYLPLYLAHGYTRREFAGQAAVFTVAFAAAFAALMTVGYGIEAVAYRVAGWPQTLREPHLFDAPHQFGVVFAEFGLVFLVATVAGALVAAGFYRHGALGVALVPVGLVLFNLAEAAVGPGHLALFWLGSIDVGGSLPAAAAACTVAFAVGLALTWAVVRDVPVRSKKA